MKHPAKGTRTPPKVQRVRRAPRTSTTPSTDDDAKIAELVGRGVLTRGEPGILPELLTPGPPAPNALKALRRIRDAR